MALRPSTPIGMSVTSASDRPSPSATKCAWRTVPQIERFDSVPHESVVDVLDVYRIASVPMCTIPLAGRLSALRSTIDVADVVTLLARKHRTCGDRHRDMVDLPCLFPMIRSRSRSRTVSGSASSVALMRSAYAPIRIDLISRLATRTRPSALTRSIRFELTNSYWSPSITSRADSLPRPVALIRASDIVPQT